MFYDSVPSDEYFFFLPNYRRRPVLRIFGAGGIKPGLSLHILGGFVK